MLDLGRKPSQVISVIFFYIENSKNRKGLVFPLCDGFRLFISMAIDGPTNRMIAPWVHPFTVASGVFGYRVFHVGAIGINAMQGCNKVYSRLMEMTYDE